MDGREELAGMLRGLERRRDVLTLLTALVVIATFTVSIIRLAPLWMTFGSAASSSAGGAFGTVIAGQYLYSEVAVWILMGAFFALSFTVWNAATQVQITSLRIALAKQD